MESIQPRYSSEWSESSANKWLDRAAAEAWQEAKRRKWWDGAVRKYARYQGDPAGYARDVLGQRWWAKQIEIAESVRDNRRTVVYAGNSTGKTFGIAGLVQWTFDCFCPSISLTTAPNWPSVHDLIWGEIRSQRPKELPGRLLDIRLEAGPLHYAKGHNADSAAGFQGRHEARVLIVLDEAMGIQPYIWDASNSMMTAPDCRWLVSGNPTETSGQYYDIRDDPSWNVIRISCLDHPNIAAELAGEAPPFPKAVSLTWVREMLARHAWRATEETADTFEFDGGQYECDDVFRSRVLGLFPKQASQSVWSEAWLERARENSLSWSDTDIPCVGVDVARFGADSTLLYARRGPVVTHREIYAKQSTMETVGRVVAMTEIVGELHSVEPRKVHVVVDDTGLGGGVTDRLRELGHAVTGVNAGERAYDPEHYYNRRSELWFGTAERAERLNLDLSRLPDDVYRKLSAELRGVCYKIQSDKSKRVESKDDTVKRLGRSPDDADAFNLAFVGAPITGTLADVDTGPSRTDDRGSRWGRTRQTGYRRR